MEKKKPIVMHLRGPKAFSTANEIMLVVGLPKDWSIHMHCFKGSWSECQNWANVWTGMKFGFTSDSFPGEVIKNLPLDKILLETDAPYFLPEKVCIQGAAPGLSEDGCLVQ